MRLVVDIGLITGCMGMVLDPYTCRIWAAGGTVHIVLQPLMVAKFLLAVDDILYLKCNFTGHSQQPTNNQP